MLPHTPFLPRIPSSPLLPHLLQLHAFPPCNCPPTHPPPPDHSSSNPLPLKPLTHSTPTSHRQMLPQTPALSSHVPTPAFPTSHPSTRPPTWNPLAHPPDIPPLRHVCLVMFNEGWRELWSSVSIPLIFSNKSFLNGATMGSQHNFCLSLGKC